MRSTAEGFMPPTDKIEIHSAKHLKAGNLFAHHIGERGGRLIVVLQHQAAHTPAFRHLRQIDSIDLAWHAIRRTMYVNINCPGQLILLRLRGNSESEEKKSAESSSR